MNTSLYQLYSKKFANCNDVFTTKEVMALVGLSESYIFREMEKGHLKSYLIKNLRYFRKKDLINFLCSEHYQKNNRIKKNF